MKKAFLLLWLAAGLLSCANESLNSQEENTQIEGIPMTFNVTVAETKAEKIGWANGDKIYVFFNNLPSKYLVLQYNGTTSTWDSYSGTGVEFIDNDFVNKPVYKLTAIYFPVAVDVFFNYQTSLFNFTIGGKPVYNFYLFDCYREYTVSGTTVTASLTMRKPDDMVQIHVAGIQNNVSAYSFYCSKIKPVACASVSALDGYVTEDVLEAGDPLSGFADTDGGIFAGRLTNPDVPTDYVFNVTSNNNACILTRTNRILTAGMMYNFPSLSTTGGSNWKTVQVVDLGITVNDKKIYWAKCNVGANTETEYGDYIAWGETTGYNNGKTDFSWSNYRWGDNYNTLTKYCNNSSFGKDDYSDDLTTLQKEDDAAYAALGGKFRMPTSSEIDALLALNKVWVSNYNNTGISGYKFTGNGNTLFLPAAGIRNGTNIENDGSSVSIWSSSLSMGTDYTGSEGHSDQPDQAYNLYSLHLSSTDYTFDNTIKAASNRCYGLSVRPVSE